MQIVTNTYLDKAMKAFGASTMEGDPNVEKSNAYFGALKVLADVFDVVHVNKSGLISGEFSISSDMAMLTDGAIVYSMDGIDPLHNKEYAIAHITDANYLITVDEAAGYKYHGTRVSYTQLFVRDDLWLIENAEMLISRCHNLESKWAEGCDES